MSYKAMRNIGDSLGLINRPKSGSAYQKENRDNEVGESKLSPWSRKRLVHDSIHPERRRPVVWLLILSLS